MIITRSPLRISLGGGGTDLPSYYREHTGFLIAAAIDKYVCITLHQTFVPELIIKPTSAVPLAGAVFFYQTVTYSFAASTLFPGKTALWRNNGNGTPEELMAPFLNTSQFNFYTSGSDASSSTVPGNLNNIIGVDVILNAVATRTPAGSKTPSQAKMVSSVFFKNVR